MQTPFACGRCATVCTFAHSLYLVPCLVNVESLVQDGMCLTHGVFTFGAVASHVQTHPDFWCAPRRKKQRPLAARHLPGGCAPPASTPRQSRKRWGRWSASMMRFAKILTRSHSLRSLALRLPVLSLTPPTSTSSTLPRCWQLPCSFAPASALKTAQEAQTGSGRGQVPPGGRSAALRPFAGRERARTGVANT